MSCLPPIYRAFVLLLLVGSAAGQGMPRELADALQRAAIPSANAAFLVQEVGARRPLLAINAQQPMNPGSVIKLFTTFAALDLLGPTYTWKTTALSAAPAADVLEGDLVLKGAGDPKLVIENFWLLLRKLRQRGIREIRGDVVLDRSLFAVATHDPARFDADPLRPYNVGPDALLVNFNAVTFRFIPDEAARVVLVDSEPRTDAGMVKKPRLVAGPCEDWRGALGADFSDPRRPAFHGVYALACGERTWSVNLLPPDDYVNLVFRQLWGELGGVLAGRVREGRALAGARLLAEQESPAMAEIVRDVNKFSNNVMARQLYLSLGPPLERLPASTERSFAIMRNWLARRKLVMPELVIENGSGLSRIERVSARGVGDLLQAAYASPLMPEFIASLPLAGLDGTMRRSMNGRPVAGHAHIKTGTLADVRAIAGYVLAPTGKRYVVVGLINHARAPAGRAVLEALLDWVYLRGETEPWRN